MRSATDIKHFQTKAKSNPKGFEFVNWHASVGPRYEYLELGQINRKKKKVCRQAHTHISTHAHT